MLKPEGYWEEERHHVCVPDHPAQPLLPPLNSCLILGNSDGPSYPKLEWVILEIKVELPSFWTE